MKTVTMNDSIVGTEQLPGAGIRANSCFSRIREFTRTPGPPRQRWTTGMWWATVVLTVSASVGCNDIYPVPPVPPDAYVSKPSNTLAPGDEIRVVFSGAPELSTQMKIQPTGKISLPTIGEVSAADRSVTALQQQLTSLYQPHLQDSTVTVSLVGTAAGVYVSGAVLRPGKLPLDRPLTVLEAVMEAGGFAPLANSKQVVVVRNQNGKSKNYVLNLHQALNGTESTPFFLRPYDVIYVRENLW